jgi:hypothetical protein
MDHKLARCALLRGRGQILNYSGAYRVIDTNYKCSVQFGERWLKRAGGCGGLEQQDAGHRVLP